MIDRSKFFLAIRPLLFSAGLRTSQVSGINAILDVWEKHSGTDPRWLAYELATTYRETAQTMQPIEEYGHGKGRAYGVPMGIWHQTYDGRGYVQLTWITGYAKATARLRQLGAIGSDIDLVRNPELAMRPDIAGLILHVGMVEGWFSGKKLSDYFTASKSDWAGARHIINGSDHAAEIAANGMKFYAALKAASSTTTKPIGFISEGDTTMIDTKPWYASQTIWGGVAAIISGLGLVYHGFTSGNMPEAIGGAVAVAGGFHSVVGRLKAVLPIGSPVEKYLDVADKAIQAGVSLVPVTMASPVLTVTIPASIVETAQ